MVSASDDAYFIGCDWGTSNMRLRLVATKSAEVRAEAQSDLGASRLAAAHPPGPERIDAYREALLSAFERLEPHLPQGKTLPVIVTGMASASIGWRELPYATLPFPLDGATVVAEVVCETLGERLGPVVLASGVRAEADVIRGEETELIGLYADGHLPTTPLTVLLPGTHSKHVTIRNNTIAGFRTFMTGEVFQTLATASILKHSVGEETKTFPEDVFAEAARLSVNEHPLHLLFRVRAEQLLRSRPAAEGRAFLSGLLIGSELHDCRARLANDERALLYAPGTLGDRYAAAARSIGWPELERIEPAAPPAVYGQRAILATLT